MDLEVSSGEGWVPREGVPMPPSIVPLSDGLALPGSLGPSLLHSLALLSTGRAPKGAYGVSCARKYLDEI